MGLEIARGMKYLHYELVPALIHRDVKSHNVLVTDDRVMKLCDFGLVTTKSTTAGTPNYMAPELLRNAPFSNSVDVYAFALLLWEIFTQELPFRGYDVDDIKKRVCRGERPEVPTLDIPVECQRIMRKGWDEDAEVRPDFDEIVELLEGALGKTPTKSALDDLDDDALFNM